MEVARSMDLVEVIRKMWYWWSKRVNCFLSKFCDFFVHDFFILGRTSCVHRNGEIQLKWWNSVEIVIFSWNVEIQLKWWNSVEIVKFGHSREIQSYLWNPAIIVKFSYIVKFQSKCEIPVKIVNFSSNCEIWSKLWNLVKIVKLYHPRPDPVQYWRA